VFSAVEAKSVEDSLLVRFCLIRPAIVQFPTNQPSGIVLAAKSPLRGPDIVLPIMLVADWAVFIRRLNSYAVV
jgi:hypothetical protein